MSTAVKPSPPKVLVKVLPGCAIFRHGKGWGPGRTVFVRADDAERMEHHGTVQLVRG